jgi:elongation factor P
MNININDIKNGMTIIIDGNLCQIVEFQHVKPGKGSAFVRIKLRNLRTGAVVENSYNTNIKIERAMVDHNHVQFLYQSGDSYVFMNTETYDQIEVPEKLLDAQKKYIKEGLEIQLDYYNSELIGVSLPEKITYKVTSTEPAVKGNTTNNAMKDATLENGNVVKVPLFINEGEEIVVSTIDGKYCGRA